MKPDVLDRRTLQTTLRLTLLSTDSPSLGEQLARHALLRHVQPTQQTWHEVYYDTPDLKLHQHRMTLGLRRLNNAAQPAWQQTLTHAPHAPSAFFNTRLTWQADIRRTTPSPEALQATPWTGIDPDGHVIDTLSVCFTTNFERTSWPLTIHGSVVQVALDQGQVVADSRTEPLCELELKLLSGQETSLFDVARHLAASMAVLPALQSKADHGYALLVGTLAQAHNAHPPALSHKATLRTAAQAALREMLVHFAANLNTLHRSDDPEVVHQARVGWRRFKSALRLFKDVLADETRPPLSPLRGVLKALGELRDLDVALTSTLPPIADIYIDSNPARAVKWQSMVERLGQAAQAQRQAARSAMMHPLVGDTLLAIAQFTEALGAPHSPESSSAVPPHQPAVTLLQWTRKRLKRSRKQLKIALSHTDQPEQQHRARILAKHLRYSTEVLQSYLPRKQARRWLATSTRLQTTLGAARDQQRALALAHEHKADSHLLEFLRGYGRASSPNT